MPLVDWLALGNPSGRLSWPSSSRTSYRLHKGTWEGEGDWEGILQLPQAGTPVSTPPPPTPLHLPDGKRGFLWLFPSFHPLHFFQEQKGVVPPVYCSLTRGLGKNVNKAFFLFHASILLSSHHSFFCRSVQFPQMNNYLSLLLSNISALLLDLFC